MRHAQPNFSYNEGTGNMRSTAQFHGRRREEARRNAWHGCRQAHVWQEGNAQPRQQHTMLMQQLNGV